MPRNYNWPIAASGFGCKQFPEWDGVIGHKIALSPERGDVKIRQKYLPVIILSVLSMFTCLYY